MFLLIEKYLFYFFLFTIPFQTRKILWYEGWRFDEWTSISIYATDILLVILFLFWAVNYFGHDYKITNYKLQITNKPERSRRGPRVTFTGFQNPKSKIKNPAPEFYLFLFVIIAAVSIKNSGSYHVSWFQWIKLVEFTVFYFYLSRYAFAKFGFINSFLAIILGGLFQSNIAIIQFLKQSSIGLWYLGESVINSDLTGIASFYLPTGEKIIRAYGTFPHPNILAAYLLFVLCSMYYVVWKSYNSRATYYTLLATYSIVLFAFFLTFSRTVIFAWAGIFIIGVLVYQNKYFQQVKNVFFVTLVVTAIFSVFYWPAILSRISISGNDQAVELRTFYNKEALGSGAGLFGVGIGNFVGWLKEKEPFLLQYEYQPVHNIYLLIYSETGLLGISSFLIFLFFLLKNSLSFHATCYMLLTTALLFIGFFDHFLWTLQQGRFIFWGGLGVLTYLSDNDIM